MNLKSAMEVNPSNMDPVTVEDEHNSQQHGVANRRSFLKKSLVAGAVATAGVGFCRRYHKPSVRPQVVH